MNVDTILLILAAICFGAVALGIEVGRVSLLGLGLLLFVLTFLI